MEYPFYTSDGYTESPNGNTVENLQVLGEAEGCSVNEAYNKLVANNDWIVSEDFTQENTYYKMIVTQEIISHIQTVIDYLWKDEKKHYEEEDAQEFALSDMYRFETILSLKHPENNNVQAKIRQQLQLLRDKGSIEFLGNGKYKRL